ncbi:MAG: phenylalanine--tRNA ligase subunit beta [Alphaproteobacteria bacterium]|nr:phenylalanine--tRNA ligase subunit beta [Alphaproteobacteria bacterium]MBN2779513.1 phenylalanine--tRNA ligase subunit beta [Alphaproteobacteria bacterium]
MKFTLDWLRDYLKTDKTPQELADTLSRIGLEVEELEDKAAALAPFITAKVLDAKPHPDADKLQVLSVSTGSGEPLQIVCGAPNARAGLIGILARSGDLIPAFGEKLKDTKIRGVESQGMMCSMKELGLGQEHDGIIDLPADTKIGVPATDVLNAAVLFDAEVTSNRPDYLGVKGIARDLAAADKGAFLEDKIVKIKGTVKSPISLKLDKGTACPHFAAIYLKDVQNKESPKWLRDRLSDVGITPKSFLIDITNYMLMDWGRPMHAFDADKLNGDIHIRMAKKGERFTAVADNKEYILSGEETVVADDKHVALISGIMGAKDSGCDEKTKNILLIAEVLKPIEIMRISRKLKIDSDSKYRFERGVDPQSSVPAINKIAGLILEHCGGEASDILQAGEIPSDDRKINYDINNFKKKIGVELPAGMAMTILQKLGCEVNQNGHVLQIVPPSFRADIQYDYDITEELIRIYGYDKIEPVSLPMDPVIKPVLTPEQIRVFRTKRLMASLGFDETLSWSFVSSKLENEIGTGHAIKIGNPITVDHDVLRTTMLSSLLPVIANNHARDQLNLSLFEIAPIFHSDKPGDQEDVLCGVLTGRTGEKSWDNSTKEIDVYEAKATMMKVLSQWGLDNSVRIDPLEMQKGFHPHRFASVKLGKVEIARFGEIHPALTEKMKIKTRVCFFEIFLGRMPVKKAKGVIKTAAEHSNLQSVKRDFSFVVPRDMPASDLISAVKKAVPQNVYEDMILFDLYQAKKEDSRKAIGISLILSPQKTTFTDKEVEKISTDVITAVEKIGVSLRIKSIEISMEIKN